MQAIILAGGKGTRLKPYTTILPKPLMPIGDIPILEVILQQLENNGFQDVILALGYKARYITTFFNDGQKLGVNLRYSYENQDLGTAGPLTLIENLEENFLVMNGDVLTDLNYNELFEEHLESGAAVTIASYTKPVNIDLGVIETDQKRVTNYIEKPTMTYLVSMGIYAFTRRALRYIPHRMYFDFPDLIKKLVKNKETVNVYQPEDCLWLDIGRIEDFERSLQIFEKYKNRFLPRYNNSTYTQ